MVGLPNNSYKPITNTAWVRAQLCKLQKKVQSSLPVACRFYPGTPASSITKTGRHDIAEILLKVALNTINQIKPNQIKSILLYMYFHMTPVTSGSFVLHINHQNGFFWVIQQSV